MRATLHMELKSKDGDTLAARRAKNSVMRAGAELIASLFAGTGAPITHMGVGTSDAPETEAFTTEGLVNEAVGDGGPLTGSTEAAIPAEAFTVTTDETRRTVVVRVRGTMPADAAVGTIREAGLLSQSTGETVLYNRVTFAPITKGDDHELTLFWEVTFPYGDLQWF